MSLTPYQQSIWLIMCARNVGYAGVAFVMIAALAVMGARFMEHQILVGLSIGALLLFLSDRIVRCIPDPQRPPAPGMKNTGPAGKN